MPAIALNEANSSDICAVQKSTDCTREIDCFIQKFCRKSTFYHNQSQVFPNCTSKSQSIFIFCHFLRPKLINHWIWEYQRTKMNFIYNTARETSFDHDYYCNNYITAAKIEICMQIPVSRVSPQLFLLLK